MISAPAFQFACDHCDHREEMEFHILDNPENALELIIEKARRDGWSVTPADNHCPWDFRVLCPTCNARRHADIDTLCIIDIPEGEFDE